MFLIKGRCENWVNKKRRTIFKAKRRGSRSIKKEYQQHYLVWWIKNKWNTERDAKTLGAE